MSELTDVLDIMNGTATSVIVPNGVTTIGQHTFDYMPNLQSITLPSSLMYINGYAFANCSNLTSISLPEGVRYSNNIFQNTNITSITMPSYSVLDAAVFARCTTLQSVLIKNYSVVNTASYMFDGCTSLREIVFEPYVYLPKPGNVTPGIMCTGLSALQRIVLPKITRIGQWFGSCTNLNTIELQTGLVTIDQYAFSGLSALTNINIPYTVRSIGISAFANCTHITQIDIPNCVSSIPNYMCNGCTGLLTVEIGTGVTSIGSYAFNNCSSLETITFKSTTPPTVGNANTWTNVPTTCTIRVPTGSLTAYTSANNYPDPNTYTYVEY